MSARYNRKKIGASLSEALAGLFFFVPIACLVVDITAAVIAQTQNDALAKHAARQAASGANLPQAYAAANNVVSASQSTSLCSSPTLLSCAFDSTGTSVTCKTQITCNLPAPIPFYGGQIVFGSIDTEPIVGQSQPLGLSTAPVTGTGGWSGNNAFLNVTLPAGTAPTMMVPNKSAPTLPTGIATY